MWLLTVVIPAAAPHWRSQPQGKAFMATFWEGRPLLALCFSRPVPLSTAIHVSAAINHFTYSWIQWG